MKGSAPLLSVNISLNKGGFCMWLREIVTRTICKDSINVKLESQATQSGFTLVEVMIVVAIIGIFAAIATLNFSQMNSKYTIESYTKEIHALLMRARNDASTSNIQRIVTLAANQIQVTRDDDGDGVVDAGEPTITYPYPRFALLFAANPIIFDRRGLTNNVQTLQTNHPGDAAPGADCIVVSATRINIGRMTGGVCVQQ